MEIEQHPLEPFLPANARLLMLGSFPPQRKRWSMEFYYPNWNNDMWRIVGLIFFGDKEHFVVKGKRAFSKDELIAFLQEKGIALYDTATAVRRLQDNASDKFLEVVQPTDVRALLEKLSQCRAIVTTGEKATDTLCRTFALTAPKVGDFTEFVFEGRPLRLYRMPSSSRAYHYLCSRKHGNSSVGRASVSKTECREFEPLFPCNTQKNPVSLERISDFSISTCTITSTLPVPCVRHGRPSPVPARCRPSSRGPR